MPDPNNYWFPAKRHGWGWGLPDRWQGWAVLLGFAALLVGGALVLMPQQGPVAFVLYAVVLSVVLAAICWWKSEPPRWR